MEDMLDCSWTCIRPMSHPLTCESCNRKFRFQDLFQLHIGTCQKPSQEFPRWKKQKCFSNQVESSSLDKLEMRILALEEYVLKQESRHRRSHIKAQLGGAPDVTWTEWVESWFSVSHKHVEVVFDEDKDVVHGIQAAFSDALVKNKSSTDLLPFRAFPEKPRDLYVWIGTWHKFTTEEWKSWMTRFRHKMMRALVLWQTEHQTHIETSDATREIHLNHLRKFHTVENRTQLSAHRRWMHDQILSLAE